MTPAVSIDQQSSRFLSPILHIGRLSVFLNNRFYLLTPSITDPATSRNSENAAPFTFSSQIGSLPALLLSCYGGRGILPFYSEAFYLNHISYFLRDQRSWRLKAGRFIVIHGLLKKEWKTRESSEPGLSGRIVMYLTVKGVFKKDMLMKFISTAGGSLQKLLWHPSPWRLCLSVSLMWILYRCRLRWDLSLK